MSTTAANTPIFEGRPGYVRWFGKSISALADQGLFSVSNFLLNICLAAWLAPADYGAFAVGISLFLLVSGLHTKLLVMPMLLFGSGDYRDDLRAYLRVLLGAHTAFCAMAGAVMLLAAGAIWLFGGTTLALTLLGLACAQPFILLLWLCRRACYLRAASGQAALAAGLYFVLMLSALFLLRRAGSVSVLGAIGIMGLSSLVADIWLLFRLKVVRPSHVPFATARRILLDHWEYGRWSIPTTLIAYVGAEVPGLLLPTIGRIEDCGTLRALANLIVPALQALAAISLLLVPPLVRSYGTPTLGRVTRLALLCMVGGPVVYWLLLGVLHVPIVQGLYHGRYVEQSGLLWLVGLLPLLEGVAFVPGTLLRANKQMRAAFRAVVWAATGGLALALPLLFVWGLRAVIMGMVAYCATEAMLLWRYYLRFLRGSLGASDAGEEELAERQAALLPTAQAGEGAQSCP